MKYRALEAIKGGNMDMDEIDGFLIEAEEGRANLWDLRKAIALGIQRQLMSLEFNAGQCGSEQRERKMFIEGRIAYYRQCLIDLSANREFILSHGSRELTIPALDRQKADIPREDDFATDGVAAYSVSEAPADETEAGPATIPMNADHAVAPHKKRTMLELLNPRHLRALSRLKRMRAAHIRKEAV